MALVATKLEREFTFKKGNTTVRLPDPNPEMTTEEVLSFYAPQYPELTTAQLEGPNIEGTKSVYSVKTTVGTHG